MVIVLMLGLQLTSLLSPSPAVLRLRDPKSRIDCILVGTMHYNPASISLARSIVVEEGKAGRLRAVAVESCPTRWNSTLRVQVPGTLLRWLCDNEMQSAAEAGNEYNVPLSLVDQTIEDTGQRAAQLLALTLAQLGTPWYGGWRSIREDFKEAFSQVALWSKDGLKPTALINLPLILGTPVCQDSNRRFSEVC